MKNKPELLAPAGSMAALRAAVDNGANAVYMGLGAFNARGNAQNFQAEELPEAVNYAHLHSVRVYITLNTLIHDSEMEEAISLARSSWEAGADSLIIQDLGLADLLRRELPEMPLHGSTQMNLFDKAAVRWSAEHGLSRVILPRELSYEEIAARTLEAERAGIETEMFIHGALCVCYSGLCLFSAMNGNGARSGNRGLCAQPCRTLFRLNAGDGVDVPSGRLLSPRDQSALPYLARLIRAGVHSFKIEGRMKDSAYVAATVRAYREFIDRIYDGEDTDDAQKDAARHLLLAFNRGGSFTTQYLQGKKKAGLLSGEYSGRYGLPIGIIVKKNARTGTLSIRMNEDIVPSRGDYLSVRSNDREVASFPIGTLEKIGDVLAVKGLHPQMIEKIPDGAHVFQMSELAYTHDLLQGKAAYKTKVSMKLSEPADDCTGWCLRLTVREGMWQGLEAAVELTVPEDTAYPELSRERIAGQLSKAKSSPFDVVSIEMAPSLSLCAPVAFLNELRREGFAALAQAILLKRRPDVEAPAERIFENEEGAPGNPNVGQLHDVVHVNYFDLKRQIPQGIGVRADYYSFSVFDLGEEAVRDALRGLHSEEPDARFLIWLPGAYKDSAVSLIDRAEKFMKDEFPESYAGMVSSKPRISGSVSWISASANLYNHYSLQSVLNEGAAAAAPSYELKDHEVIDMLEQMEPQSFSHSYLSLHRYGRIEWMQSEFCPVGRHESGCRKCREKDKFFTLQILSQEDGLPKRGKELPVVAHPGLCMSEILGTLHSSVGEELLLACGRLRIPVAHTVRFLDEPLAERLSAVEEIRAGITR